MLKLKKRIEVPVPKRRRVVLPLNINTPEETAAASATGEEVSRLPLQRKEESCLDNLKDNTVQWKQPASLSPHKSLPLDTQPKKEKKCVKFVASPANTEALHEQSGNIPISPRLSEESRLPTKVKERKEAISKLEKGASKKSHTIMYVSKKSTPEMQCPQQ